MIADRIRQLRKEHGISQQRLAETLGVSQQTIAGWEGGRTCPDRFIIARLVEIFHVSSDYLLGITDDTRPSVLPEDLPELSGSYLSMARLLRDEGVTQQDLRIMLEIHKRFSELNEAAELPERELPLRES